MKLKLKSVSRYFFKDSIRNRILKDCLKRYLSSKLKTKEYEKSIAKLTDYLLRNSYHTSSFAFQNFWGNDSEIASHYDEVLAEFLDDVMTKDLVINFLRDNDNIFYRDICSKLFDMTHEEFFQYEKKRIQFENM